MKRWFLLFLILLCINGLALAESGDFQYTVNEDNSGLTITGYTGSDKKVVVPPEIDGWKVSCIGESAFENQSQITKVTLPKGITSIESKAFAGCTALTSINLHKSIMYIANDAFDDCNNLLSKVYPDSYAHSFFASRDLPYQYFSKNDATNYLKVDSEEPASPSLEPFSMEEAVKEIDGIDSFGN